MDISYSLYYILINTIHPIHCNKYLGFEKEIVEARVQAEKGGLVSIKLEAFDISTDPCMPQPSQLQYTTVPFFLLVGIVLVCLFSTFFSAYSARWRPQICNLFYPELAEPRAHYLKKKIFAGRGYRRAHLVNIASRESSRREKILELSPASKILFIAKRCLRLKTKICHGCRKKLSTSDNYSERTTKYKMVR